MANDSDKHTKKDGAEVPGARPAEGPGAADRNAGSRAQSAAPVGDEAHASTRGQAGRQAVLDGLLEVLRPLATLAIDHDVRLPELVDLMKVALVSAANAPHPGALEPLDAGAASDPLSDSRIAVMTGVHRKDLRRMRESGEPGLRQRRKSVSSEVFARWTCDPAFLTRRGKPRILPRSSPPDRLTPGFEDLSHAVTRDVHPRAVLEEMIRLRLVEVDARDRVRLIRQTFVPDQDADTLMSLASANLSDHVAAVCANVYSQRSRRFLEQAVFADDLSEESAQVFNDRSLSAWRRAFQELMPLLQDLWSQDVRVGRPRVARVRVGMYGFVGQAAQSDVRAGSGAEPVSGADPRSEPSRTSPPP